MNVNSAQMSDLLNLAQVEKIKDSEENGKLQEACKDFESVLLNYMFQSMQKTVGSDGGIFGESFQRNMYESLYIEKIADKIAAERDLGIGDALYRQLAAKLEAAGETGDEAGGLAAGVTVDAEDA